ncbi:MAG: VWA domain-containing protein [Bryobacteraceae bacterium]
MADEAVDSQVREVLADKKREFKFIRWDDSGSMAADDLKPTRMEAAKTAARDFVVGDKFLVVITGPAGEAVTAKASQNGGALASATFGFTDAGGRLSVSGEMRKRELGAWQEEWAVGGVLAKPLRFVVRPR